MAEQDGKKGFQLGDLPGELTRRGREVWLAGLGAMAAVEEEGSKWFNDLVKRGEKMEEEGKKQLDEAVSEVTERQEKATKAVGESVEGTVGTIEETVSRAVRRVMERLDVPAREEVRTLSVKVEELTKKVDRLADAVETRGKTGKQGTAAQARTTFRVTPREDGWAVMKEGSERAASVHETKKEAVESGRERAKGQAPSQLVVYKQDGGVQETLTYDA